MTATTVHEGDSGEKLAFPLDGVPDGDLWAELIRRSEARVAKILADSQRNKGNCANECS